MSNRYSIEYGKFGAYFYDTQEDKDQTLTEVLKLLNKQEDQENLRIRRATQHASAEDMRRLLSVFIDARALPSHGVTAADWEAACALCGRSCDPLPHYEAAPVLEDGLCARATEEIARVESGYAATQAALRRVREERRELYVRIGRIEEKLTSVDNYLQLLDIYFSGGTSAESLAYRDLRSTIALALDEVRGE